MSMQGRYIEDDRLSALAEQSARLCRKAGPVLAKATVSKLRAAMSEIDAAYEKVAERFGTAASVPDACRWLLDNRYIAVREAKCASLALLREKSLRGSEAGVILLDMCRTLVDAGSRQGDRGAVQAVFRWVSNRFRFAEKGAVPVPCGAAHGAYRASCRALP